jgi:hypothetical protein
MKQIRPLAARSHRRFCPLSRLARPTQPKVVSFVWKQPLWMARESLAASATSLVVLGRASGTLGSHYGATTVHAPARG